MKSLKLGKRNLITALLLSVFCFMLIPTKAYAYDANYYEIEEDDSWIVTSEIGTGASVYVHMFVWVQPEIKDRELVEAYTFYSTDAEFQYDCSYEYPPEIGGQLIYYIKSLNSQPTDTFQDSPIWSCNFMIEPGLYGFAPINGCVNHTLTLSQNCNSPLESDGYSKDEITEVKEGDVIYLYTMLGEDEWKTNPENVHAFVEWAKETDAKINPDKHVDDTVDSETTITVESDNTEVPVIEETKPETIMTEAPVEIPETEEIEQEPKNNNLKIVIGILVLAVFFIGGTIYVNKRKSRDEDDK